MDKQTLMNNRTTDIIKVLTTPMTIKRGIHILNPPRAKRIMEATAMVSNVELQRLSNLTDVT